MKNRHMAKLLFVFLLGFALLVAGCSASTGDNNAEKNAGDNSTNTAPKTEGETEPSGEPIKVGVILPITGYAAVSGESAKRAVDLHVEEINAAGGINGQPIEMVLADSEGKPEVAVCVAEKMISEDVVVIGGPFLTPTSFAVAPLAAEANVPMIAMSGGFQPTGDKFPLNWTVVAGAGSTIEQLVNYMIETDQRRLASITPTDPLGDEGDKALERYIEDKYKGEVEWVAHEKYNLQDVDVTGQLSKIKAQNPELVFVGASGESVVTIRKQMNQVGMQEIPLVTYNSNTTREFINLVGDTPGKLYMTATAAVIPNDLPDGSLKEKSMAFAKAYEEKYGEPPMSTEGIAYDVITVIAEAIKAVGSDSEKIAEWLNEGQTIIGVNQEYNYTAQDHVGGDYTDLFMVEAEGGEWKRIR